LTLADVVQCRAYLTEFERDYAAFNVGVTALPLALWLKLIVLPYDLQRRFTPKKAVS